MNLLLDIHDFLWAVDDALWLSPTARVAITNSNNLVHDGVKET